jgi:hypothetical protein
VPTEVLPFITLIIGWVLSEMGSWFKDQREERARKRMRAEQKLDQEVNFQRQTLIDLQEQLFELAKITGDFYSEDTIVYKKSGVWGKNYKEDELNQRQQDIIIRANILTVRVADDQLRYQADRMRSFCTTISIARSPDEADEKFNEVMQLFGELNDHLGKLLRSTY